MVEVDLFGNFPGEAAEARATWQQQRDAALRRVAKNAGRQFVARAVAFVEAYLAERPHASAEVMTDACKAAGIKPPHDDRAFGPVYHRLAKAGKIVKCGEVRRTRGHGTAGGNLWRLAA